MRGMKAAMEKGKVKLSISPLRWLGVKGWFGEEMLAQFKGAAYIRAWDPDSKTWWVPENFEPLIRAAFGVPQNVPPDIRLEKRPLSADLKARLEYGRVFGLSIHDATQPLEPHWLDGDPYKVLMVDSGAPMGLVDWAYQFWKLSFSYQQGGVGGSDEPLRRVEEAYATIKTDRLASSELVQQGVEPRS